MTKRQIYENAIFQHLLDMNFNKPQEIDYSQSPKLTDLLVRTVKQFMSEKIFDGFYIEFNSAGTKFRKMKTVIND